MFCIWFCIFSVYFFIFFFFFFFSSRRRHTRFDCDWSSDVCSSDLADRIAITSLSSHFEEREVIAMRSASVRSTSWVHSGEIGRASCRERVESSVVAGSLKKKKKEIRG